MWFPGISQVTYSDEIRKIYTYMQNSFTNLRMYVNVCQNTLSS